jgi:hypothetical protein
VEAGNGGIYNYDNLMTLTDCTISDNTVDEDGDVDRADAEKIA